MHLYTVLKFFNSYTLFFQQPRDKGVNILSLQIRKLRIKDISDMHKVTQLLMIRTNDQEPGLKFNNINYPKIGVTSLYRFVD